MMNLNVQRMEYSFTLTKNFAISLLCALLVFRFLAIVRMDCTSIEKRCNAINRKRLNVNWKNVRSVVELLRLSSFRVMWIVKSKYTETYNERDSWMS